MPTLQVIEAGAVPKLLMIDGKLMTECCCEASCCDDWPSVLCVQFYYGPRFEEEAGWFEYFEIYSTAPSGDECKRWYRPGYGDGHQLRLYGESDYGCPCGGIYSFYGGITNSDCKPGGPLGRYEWNDPLSLDPPDWVEISLPEWVSGVGWVCTGASWTGT